MAKAMQLAWDSGTHKNKPGGGYNRDRSSELYHTSRWTRLSRAFRAMHPLCEECKKRGIIKSAEVVDHVIPYPICEDFFDTNNLQSLCSDCNVTKGNRDKKVIAEWKRRHRQTQEQI